jgi:predicted esterase
VHKFLPGLWLSLILAGWVSCGIGVAAEQKLTCPMGREYYLYTPDKIEQGKTYWLVVGVHPYKGDGRGAGGLADWVKRGDCIVVGPTFPSEGYQGLQKESDRQLIGVFAELKKKYSLHPKMFLAGFSGGAQFAHRFALKCPDEVVGCAAHSGGTWADQLGERAVGVPFAVSCGEKDTAKTTPDAPMSRVEWAKAFVGKLQTGGFYFKARVWPGVGHEFTRGARDLTEECFNFAVTGMHEDQRREVQKELAAIDGLVKAGRFPNALARIAKLPELKAPAGATQPGVKDGPRENKYGWVEGAAGKDAVAATRLAYLKNRALELTAGIERIGLDKVAATEKLKPADAPARLAALQKEFEGLEQVSAAIARALAALGKTP